MCVLRVGLAQELAHVSAGQYFGEIALVRECPRTAQGMASKSNRSMLVSRNRTHDLSLCSVSHNGDALCICDDHQGLSPRTLCVWPGVLEEGRRGLSILVLYLADVSERIGDGGERAPSNLSDSALCIDVLFVSRH